MKHNHTSVIVRIILWTLTALILLGVLLCGMGFYLACPSADSPLAAGISIIPTVQNTKWATDRSPSNLHSVEINWVDGSVNVTVTDGDSVVFREEAADWKRQRLRYRVAGDRLIIQYCKPQWSFGIFDSPRRI